MCLDRVRNALWPGLMAPTEINRDIVFQPYVDTLASLDPDHPSALDKELLDLAQKLFDETSARRTAIESDASSILAANSIVVSLIAIGFGSLKDLAQSADIRLVLGIYLIFVLALVYLGRAIYYAMRIGVGITFRSTLGPDDIAPLPPVEQNCVSPYHRQIARKLIAYTIDNYKANNILRANLRVAQESLRHGIMVIVIGGIVIAFYSGASLLLHPTPLLEGI